MDRHPRTGGNGWCELVEPCCVADDEGHEHLDEAGPVDADQHLQPAVDSSLGQSEGNVVEQLVGQDDAGSGEAR